MENVYITQHLDAARENLRTAKSRTRSKVAKIHILKAMLELDQLHTYLIHKEGDDAERNHC